MAKRKMFKELTNSALEGMGTDGGWRLFGTIDKQQTQLKSAYVDKVRISYILYDLPSTGTPSSCGIMFAASIEDTLDSTVAENNDGKIYASSAGRAPGGVVSLDIKRSIKSNAEEIGRADGPVYLFVRNTDGMSTTNTLLTVETHGRWTKTTLA